MAKKLFVGSLPYSMTSARLEELFTPFGTVETAEVIIDRRTGQSKGFGFVEMGKEEEAKKAIENLNGKDIDGRTIVVNEARPREPKPFFGGDNNRGSSRGFGGGRSRRF